MRALIAVLFLACSVNAAAQPASAPLMPQPQTLLLWPGGAPGALGEDDSDKPAITVYMPPNTDGSDDGRDHRAGRQLRASVDEQRRTRCRPTI